MKFSTLSVIFGDIRMKLESELGLKIFENHECIQWISDQSSK